MSAMENDKYARYRKAHPDRVKDACAKYRTANLDKVRAADAIRSAARRQADPEKAREAVRRATHKALGMPEPTRPRPATCDCCGGPPNGKGVLHLDHCHISGAFRGWLCDRCNRGLGFFDDSIAGLMNAVRYLERAAKTIEVNHE